MMYSEFLEISRLSEKDVTFVEYTDLIEPVYSASPDDKKTFWRRHGREMVRNVNARRLEQMRIAELQIADLKRQALDLADIADRLSAENSELRKALRDREASLEAIARLAA